MSGRAETMSRDLGVIMPKPKPSKGMRRFVATVKESFSDTFTLEAKDEADARRIIDESMPDDFSPAETGGGYRREIYIDPD